MKEEEVGVERLEQLRLFFSSPPTGLIITTKLAFDTIISNRTSIQRKPKTHICRCHRITSRWKGSICNVMLARFGFHDGFAVRECCGRVFIPFADFSIMAPKPTTTGNLHRKRRRGTSSFPGRTWTRSSSMEAQDE